MSSVTTHWVLGLESCSRHPFSASFEPQGKPTFDHERQVTQAPLQQSKSMKYMRNNFMFAVSYRMTDPLSSQIRQIDMEPRRWTVVTDDVMAEEMQS